MVKRTLLVFRRDYREMIATPAFRIMLIVAAAITVGASVIISIVLHRQSWYGDPEARPILDFITGLVTYFLSLIVQIAFIWAFASFPVIKEKVNGNIECLMATSLSPKELLAGKGLAVFIPGYIITLIALGIILTAVNLTVYLPGWNTLVVPAPTLVLSLVINPLLFLSVLLLTLIMTMAGNPDAAAAPSFIVGFGLMIGMPVGLGTGFFNVSLWSFALWYLAGTAAAWVVTLIMSRLLTRQGIVLSSKGG
jgi:ABC-type transport system involved in multi-copper enzyme maturation permease subunit